MRLDRRSPATPTSRPRSRTGSGARAATRARARGQALVEFAFVFAPMVLLLLALMQFGFIFNGYITMTNAVREAARTATLYPYDRTLTKDNNDLARNNSARTALTAAFNGLNPASPNFVSTGSWSKSSLTWTSTDMVVTVVIPENITDNDPRQGERITVQATYHLKLFIPLIGDLLSKDGGGRLPITTESTMVIN